MENEIPCRDYEIQGLGWDEPFRFVIGEELGHAGQASSASGSASISASASSGDDEAGFEATTRSSKSSGQVSIKEEEEGAGTKRRRRKHDSPPRSKNAEHCRRHREKRKREEQKIRDRNQELERERELFLSRIADLETEVACLRGGGQVDFLKENQLLRAEIRKHKDFVKKIVQTTTLASEVTPEEQYRLLRSFLDNGCAQTIGLAYTSAADPSWKRADVLEFNGYKLRTWTQCLPRNEPIDKAHRLNIRVDVLDFDVPIQDLQPKLWKIFSNPEITNQMYSRGREGTVKRTVTEAKLPEGVARIREQQNQEDIRILKMRLNTDGPAADGSDPAEGELLLITSHKETQVFPCAYEPYVLDGTILDDLNKEDPDNAVVFVASSCSATLENASMHESLGTQPKNVMRIDAPLHLGLIARTRKASPGRTDLTMLASYPVGVESYKRTEGLQNDVAVVTENGSLGPKFKADLEMNFGMILAQL
mmetsp:Transcript_24080/g.42521  ORF Transcript_24080/g.42521 Transcript_24080/m.42521 type:complete len:479 (-) Transcript_24080:61-1497(-)